MSLLLSSFRIGEQVKVLEQDLQQMRRQRAAMMSELAILREREAAHAAADAEAAQAAAEEEAAMAAAKAACIEVIPGPVRLSLLLLAQLCPLGRARMHCHQQQIPKLVRVTTSFKP